MKGRRQKDSEVKIIFETGKLAKTITNHTEPNPLGGYKYCIPRGERGTRGKLVFNNSLLMYARIQHIAGIKAKPKLRNLIV